MNDNLIETEIQAKGLTAPRITPADIEANIIREVYFTAEHGLAGAIAALELHQRTPDVGHENALRLLTFCVLVLRNGFTVTGESACASPENFNAEIGRKIARENAVNKMWPLMGYELRSKLAAVPTDFRDRVRAEAAELDERIQKLAAFLPSETFNGLPNDEQDRLIAQLTAMESYSKCLAGRIATF